MGSTSNDHRDYSTMERIKFLKYLPLFISIILFFIPFFWLQPGEMDLGGDSSRLYFYDPLAYLLNQSAYSVISSGIGGEAISYYGIPFFLLIALIKFLVKSPTILISIFHGLAISLAFYFSYLSVKELLHDGGNRKNDRTVILASLLAGIFYIFSPTFLLGWDKVLPSHNQIFLNPLVFYLLLRFFITSNLIYILVGILISFLFASNFSFVAAPPFFAFYPLVFLFLLSYHIVIKQRRVPVKKLFIGGGLFLLVHAFHLFPLISNLLSSSSAVNTAVFSAESKFSRGLSYFSALVPHIKVSIHLMNLPQMSILQIFSYGFIVFPILVLWGYILRKNKLFLLTGIFFLISLFFVTASIINIGVEFYKSLFNIPGFSMFRNFFGQWSYVFIFFYTLLLGQALSIIFEKIHFRFAFPIGLYLFFILLFNAIPFIKGDLIKKIHHQSNDVKMTIKMDPEYEKVLSYIRSIPIDGKFLSFPLTGPGYQMIAGKEGGAYQGPSTISYLTGKNDFTGYDGLIPFHELFLQLVRNKDYVSIERLLALLNIKYIFHNADPYIYDTNFPKYPYDYVREFMPEDQKAYRDFIKNLPVKSETKIGKYYTIYFLNNDKLLPHFYVATNIIYSDDPISPYFVFNDQKDFRSAVIPLKFAKKEADVLLRAENNSPISETKNNYHLHVHSPFISRKPGELLYPFILLREKQTLKSKEKTPDDYLDHRLLYLSKRVFEVLTYGDDMQVIRAPWVEPRLWEVQKYGSYNSWEASIQRYEAEMNALIDWVSTANKSTSSKKAMKLKIRENLDQHELSLVRYIKNSSLLEKNKEYLLTLSKSMFTRLEDKLDLELYDTSRLDYLLSFSEKVEGEYEVYIKDIHNVPSNNLTILINNEKLMQVEKKDKNGLIRFANITLKEETNFQIQHDLPNLIEESSWKGRIKVEENDNLITISLDSQAANNRGGIVKDITQWKPNRQYVISFDYRTDGKDFIFKIYDKSKEKDLKTTYDTYMEKNLNSTNWKTQQIILTSHPEAIEAYIQFYKESEADMNKLYIRNMSVVEIPEYEVFFKKITGSDTKIPSIPKITFSKINPTKYRIFVENATNEYMLVFAEAFSNHWKLYKISREQNKGQHFRDIVASYYNGKIKEGNHSNKFLDTSIFETFGLSPIATQRHISTNGYANAWEIQPSDVNNERTYELIVEYKTQQNFYLFFLISIITIIGITGYLVAKLFKNEKK